MSDRYAVVGNPVEHSLSPRIHAAFARATGQKLHYGRLLCPLDDFAGTLQRFAAQTEGGFVRGCNVTVPFKFEAFALAARHSERALLAGAVNTLRFDAAGWWGDNTDGVGLLRDIEGNAGHTLAGTRVLILGAGGAAAGVLGPLLGAAPASITLANRTVAKAAQLLERHRALAGTRVRLEAVALDAPSGRFDVVINATAASLQGTAAWPPLAGLVGPGTLAVDMMYGPKAAPFLDEARRHGAQARDGLGMLVEQAAEAFFLWRGVRPQTAPVLAMLREGA